MSENMYCSGQIGNSKDYRDNYDKIFGKKRKPYRDIAQDEKSQPDEDLTHRNKQNKGE